MNETEMIERYRIISTYEGEEFKTKLEETLSEMKETEKATFLLIARDRNIQDSKKDLQQSKMIRERREKLFQGV